MSTHIIVVFAGGQQRTDKERSIPPDEQGQHVATHALDESQDKTCARVSPLMHLTDSLGLLPERLLPDVKMGGRADLPVKTTPCTHHVTGAHRLDCAKSPSTGAHRHVC